MGEVATPGDVRRQCSGALVMELPVCVGILFSASSKILLGKERD